MNALESISQEGKKVISAVGIALTLSCAPAVRAQRDYDRYPERKAEIALYNMQQIAVDVCTKHGLGGRTYPYCEQMNISEQGLEYVEKKCLRSHSERIGGANASICDSDQRLVHSLLWDDVRKIIPSGWDNVRICLENRECVTVHGFRNEEQVRDFAEAMNIYVMEQ